MQTPLSWIDFIEVWIAFCRSAAWQLDNRPSSDSITDAFHNIYLVPMLPSWSVSLAQESPTLCPRATRCPRKCFHFRFSRRRAWRWLSSGFSRRVVLVEVYRRFRGAYCVHHHGSKQLRERKFGQYLRLAVSYIWGRVKIFEHVYVMY
jgi:hypothetical protein